VDVTVTNPRDLGRLRRPTTSPSAARAGCGDGYRFVASDGGIFDFGSAAFEGSTGGMA
jgi:hypothetical protein